MPTKYKFNNILNNILEIYVINRRFKKLVIIKFHDVTKF